MRDLLTLLCHYPYDSSSKERLRELLNKINDWDHLVRLINAHGIIALAAYNITEAGLESMVPQDAMAKLENGRRQSYVRNLWLTERWKEVNKILSKAGIKHVLLKGMALEHTLYESKGLRQMNDNDILIKQEYALKAWNLLRQYGYEPETAKSAILDKIQFEIGKHLPCLYKDGYALEIHHKLFSNNETNLNNIRDPVDESSVIKIGDENAWMLSKPCQLKHLIDHYNRHALEGDCQLRLYTDIILLDRSASPVIKDTFIYEPIQCNKTKYLKAAYKINFKSIPSKYKILFLIGDIFPSLSWMKKRYNCWAPKAFLYYPYRIGKLLWLI